MVSIELHETYKWNTMIIKINKSEFHLLLTPCFLRLEAFVPDC